MGRADRWQSGLQRMVTTGEVIYVHQASRKPRQPPLVPAAPALAAEPDAEPKAESAPETEPAEAPPPILVHTGLESWIYTPAPPGYAHEFGTGRIVPAYPGFGPD